MITVDAVIHLFVGSNSTNNESKKAIDAYTIGPGDYPTSKQ